MIAALALTCFVGSLSVSAEAITGSIAASDVTVTPGSTSVTVPLRITTSDNLYAVIAQVSLDIEGAKLTSVQSSSDDFIIDEAGKGYNIDNGIFLIQYYNLAQNDGFTDTNDSISATFSIPASLPAGSSYDIFLSADAHIDGASFNESPATITPINQAKVRVENMTTEPVLDEKLTIRSASVGYGTSSLQVAFRIDNSVLNLYDNVSLVIIPQKYDTATMNLVENPAEIIIDKSKLVAAGSTRKQYYYTDIQLYEMGLNIDYMLKAYDAEGNCIAYSKTYTTSAATYLKTSFAASSDAKFRTLVTDTLVVGAESAINTAKSYANSDLAKATSVIDGFDVSEATPEIPSYNTVDSFVSKNAEYGTASSATHQVRSSAAVGKVPYINLRIADSKKALDLNKLAVKVSYTSKDSTGEHPYEKTFTGSDFTYAGKYIQLRFDEIGLHDGDKDILFSATYDGAPVFDWTYSVESYLGANLDGAIGDLAAALIKLGISFRAYSVK